MHHKKLLLSWTGALANTWQCSWNKLKAPISNEKFLTKPCTWSADFFQACAWRRAGAARWWWQRSPQAAPAQHQRPHTCMALPLSDSTATRSMRTSSLLGSRNDEWTCLLGRKPCKSSNDQNGVTTAESGSAWSAALRLDLHTTRRPQHLTEDKIIYAIAFLLIVLDPTNGTQSDAFQSLRAFVTRVVTNQHLPVQDRCLCLCHRTKAVLPRRSSVFKKVVLK